MSGVEPHSDAWAPVVNMREASSKWAVGAKAYVLQMPGCGINCQVLVRSRSGRWIRIWTQIKRVCNPRVKWVPPRLRERAWACDEREWAQRDVDRLKLILNEAA